MRGTAPGLSLQFWSSTAPRPLVNSGFVFGAKVLRGEGRKDGPKLSLNSQAPGCLHPVVQDLRSREAVKASTNEPMYNNDSS